MPRTLRVCALASVLTLGCGSTSSEAPPPLAPGAKQTRAAEPQPEKPKPKPEPMRVAGQLPPRVIKQVVRDNFDTFARCYEGGLARNGDLSGIVTASFVIGTSGAVQEVRDGGSDFPDASVVKCVLDAFAKLQVPAPDGGIVLVTYPLALSAD